MSSSKAANITSTENPTSSTVGYTASISTGFPMSSTLGYATSTSNEFPMSTTAGYDHEGAMKFIVVTTLVYALMGTVSMLLLRIRRSTRQASHKTFSDNSVQEYLKEQKMLEIESFRHKLRCEQKKCLGDYLYLGRGIHASTDPQEAVQGIVPLLTPYTLRRKRRHHLVSDNMDVVIEMEGLRDKSSCEDDVLENGSCCSASDESRFCGPLTSSTDRYASDVDGNGLDVQVSTSTGSFDPVLDESSNKDKVNNSREMNNEASDIKHQQLSV